MWRLAGAQLEPALGFARLALALLALQGSQEWARHWSGLLLVAAHLARQCVLDQLVLHLGLSALLQLAAVARLLGWLDWA